MKPKLSTFTIWATVESVRLVTEIGAVDLDEALQKAKTLGMGDFVDFDGALEDYENFQIIGLLK